MGLNVFDLDARIGISTKKFIDAVKEAGKSGKDLSKELDNVNPHVKAVENRLDEAAKAAEETKKKVNDLSDAYNKSAKEAGKDADETKELADELKKAEKELEKAKREVNYLEKELEKESQAAEEGAGETKKLGTEVKTAGDNAEKSSSKFKDLASNIKDGLEAAAKVGVVAVGAAATGVSALVKSSVAEYSEYEQLVGGVNKLFGEAGNSVIENAMNAYATSGMSANEYMSQVTGFAASLIQATGRGEQQNIDDLQDALDEEYALTKQTLADEYDAVKENWNDRIKESRKAKDGEADLLTKQRDEELKALKKANEEKLNTLKQHNKDVIAETERANNQSESTFESLTKAADLADVAMRSISDNVNTFGTDMASVQNAYQGFAKQNYTMLDNLRLGYGGTKAEMERLIDDANEYAESIGEASDLSINSFADIVTAIDLIQKKQGIWKTTEKEAAGTITGSISAVRAAWKNLTVEMAKEDGDVNKAFQILGENFGGVIMNILPKVQNAIGGVGTLITQAAPQISKGLQDLLPKVLPQLIKSAGQLVSAVGQGVITSLPTLLDTGKELLASIADIDFEGNGVIGDLLDAIVGNVDEYFGYGERILSNIGNAIINADHSKLGETFSKVITSGLNSITDLLADLDMQKVGKNIADFINAVDWKAIAQSVVDLLGAALGSLGDIAISFFTNINGESFLNALAVFAAPKLLGSMLTAFKGSECQTQFGSIRDYMGAEIGKGGKDL